MNLSCALCDKQADTQKEKVVVTIEWVLKELLKLNDIEHNMEFPRVVKVCNDCWENRLKKKTEKEDYFWEFSKEI